MGDIVSEVAAKAGISPELAKKGLGVILAYLKNTMSADNYAKLQAAEQRIALLAGLDGDGKPLLQPFDHAASDSIESDTRRRPMRAKPKDSAGLY